MSLDWCFAHPRRGSSVDNHTEEQREADTYRLYVRDCKEGHQRYLESHKWWVDNWKQRNIDQAVIESWIDKKATLLRAVGISEEDIVYVTGRKASEPEEEAGKTAETPTEKQVRAYRMASKICSIANSIPRPVSRKEAFTRARAIVTEGSLELKVAGVTFGSRQIALKRLTSYTDSEIEVSLSPEPENPVDKNAVAVMVSVNGGNQYRIGYVPAENTKTVRVFNGAAHIKVIPGTTFGARLSLAIA